MEKRTKQTDDFFNHYCEVFNRALNTDSADAELTTALFSDCFIGANPLGVNCGQNNDTFKDAIQKGYSFYKSIGITSMDIVSKTITVLNDFHTMARILWKSNFQKANGQKGSIEFENIYFIQTREDQHKVFAYITGDEQAALKEAGLLPST